jgi:histidinol-phosphatase (PHP family)
MLATYHNHSTWSDGKATIAEIVGHARQAGIDELGVSDHLTLHPSGQKPKWSMRAGDVPAYLIELKQLAAQSGRPVIRAGLEVDWFDDHASAIGAALQQHDVDYVIGSVHYVGEATIDLSPESWKVLSPAERDERYRGYWQRIRRMAESGLYDIAAHLDLPKKFGFYPQADMSRLVEQALDAIAKAKMVVELNTAGWHKPCEDAYPSLDILRACRERDIAVTLSADAHQPAHLTRDFGRGALRLREAGFTHLARFEKRKMWLEPIESPLEDSAASSRVHGPTGARER